MNSSKWLFYYKVSKSSPAIAYAVKEFTKPERSSIYRQLTNIAHLKSYSEYGFKRVESMENINDILKYL